MRHNSFAHALSLPRVLGTILLLIATMVCVAPLFYAQSTREALVQHTRPLHWPLWVPLGLVPKHGLNLGLDLQGGSQLLLELDAKEFMTKRVKSLRMEIRDRLRKGNIAFSGGIEALASGAKVTIRSAVDLERARTLLLEGLNRSTERVSIETLGTGSLAVTLQEKAMELEIGQAVSRAIEILRRRIDPTGTKEYSLQRQGQRRILIQVPGEQNAEHLETLLGSTAQLEFRFVANQNSLDYDYLDSTEGGTKIPIERRVVLSGEDITDAEPSFAPGSRAPEVMFRLNARGTEQFARVTSEGIGRQLAIVLDQRVISAPMIRSQILGGEGQITGSYTVESAAELALLLKSGALPAKFTLVERRSVGPSLGHDSAVAGLRSVLCAGVLVFILMLACYRGFGLFANIALLVHVAMILALLTLFGASLTLPGIAGIVLTIGTAVDSNVLIYERIREEKQRGSSLIQALEVGYAKAFATIVDSNMTMGLAALILFWVGSGPVRGFAVVFLFGVLTTLITAVTLTRMMIALWLKLCRPKTLPYC